MNPLLASQLVFALDSAYSSVISTKEAVDYEARLLEEDPSQEFSASWKLSQTFEKVNDLVRGLNQGLEGSYTIVIPSLDISSSASCIAGFLVYLEEIESVVSEARDALRQDTIEVLERETLVTDDAIYNWLETKSE